jgi:glycosyltransferase involved in cell wall biosynthesis
MRVLHVNHLLDAVTGGGTAERTYQLARFMAKAGVECTVLTLEIGLSDERKAGLGDVRVHTLPCLNERFFIPCVHTGEIRRLVADADIVLISGHWTILNALVFRACHKLHKPYLFCPAGALQPFGRSLVIKRLYNRLVGRNLAQSAAACVAVTEAERTEFSAYGVPDDRIEVIPNGIDPDGYQLKNLNEAVARFRQTSGIGSARYVLFLGRLNWIKGPDLLLEAYCRVVAASPDVHLVLAGPDGGMLTQLQDVAAASGFGERIHFPGYLAGDEKRLALRQATLLAIPSRREAMSIVVLEAGIVGTPVLFTDTCGLADFASAGAGTMAPATADGLEQGLRTLLADPGSASASAVPLQQRVQSDYLWSHQARRYLALFERLLYGSRR